MPDRWNGSGAPLRGPALEGFEQFAFEAGEIAHAVYHAGAARAPALLLMPEIAGFAPGLIGFARRLVQSDFQVYLPWLFGRFGERTPRRNALRLCISREFANLRSGVSAPVTLWLRALAAHVSEHNGGACIGAIGMCLSGAFVIPLVIDPRVVAAVAAQPSVPLSLLFAGTGRGGQATRRALNVSEADIAQARARLDSGGARVLAVRFAADRICPAEKLERLREEFPVGLETREYCDANWRNGEGQRPHATFTKEWRIVPDAPSDHPSRQAFRELVEFFDRHLRSAAQDPSSCSSSV